VKTKAFSHKQTTISAGYNAINYESSCLRQWAMHQMLVSNTRPGGACRMGLIIHNHTTTTGNKYKLQVIYLTFHSSPFHHFSLMRFN